MLAQSTESPKTCSSTFRPAAQCTVLLLGCFVVSSKWSDMQLQAVKPPRILFSEQLNLLEVRYSSFPRLYSTGIIPLMSLHADLFYRPNFFYYFKQYGTCTVRLCARTTGVWLDIWWVMGELHPLTAWFRKAQLRAVSEQLGSVLMSACEAM